MLNTSLIFKNVSYSYPGGSSLLQELVLHLQDGWTGVVGANGVGKSTLLKLACGILSPSSGEISAPPLVHYVEQRTDYLPSAAEDFFASYEREACRLRGKLEIEECWLYRWSTLSHGERKRIQIAVALWCSPSLLAIDEPTNHLDAAAKELVISALHSFEGVGLIVSHDREVLDLLCTQCVYFDPPHVKIRPGGVTQGLVEEEREEAYLSDRRRQLDEEYGKLRRLVVQQREESSRSKARCSKKGLSRHDHDSRARANAARISGKDAVPGRMARTFESRLSQVDAIRQEVVVKAKYELGVQFAGTRSRKTVIASLEEGRYEVGDRDVYLPSLLVQHSDRIAITGRNGVGKSTLISVLLQHLHIPREDVIYIPQEVDEGTSRIIAKKVRELPEISRGQVLSLLSRLNSRPGRVLESELLSPGEARKLLLCLGLQSETSAIILDEPTNHLDLPSVKALEEALEEFQGAIFIVSHDRHFVQNICRTEWRLTKAVEDKIEIIMSSLGR